MIKCGACVVVCPVEAIYHEDEDKQAELTENHFCSKNSNCITALFKNYDYFRYVNALISLI
ncbi:ferredoxin family protein [Lysinibacillus sphaericus]|uniref:4Fe-4S dicluster domain-containing protein n=1 Tax=Lysinibacillus sphaericus TaxID=1421 RepID=UPI003F7B1ED4